MTLLQTKLKSKHRKGQKISQRHAYIQLTHITSENLVILHLKKSILNICDTSHSISDLNNLLNFALRYK